MLWMKQLRVMQALCVRRSKRRCSNCSPCQHNRCCNAALPGATPLPKPAKRPSLSSSKRSSLPLLSSSSSSALASSCPPSLPAARASICAKTNAGASAGAGRAGADVGVSSAAKTAANAADSVAGDVAEERTTSRPRELRTVEANQPWSQDSPDQSVRRNVGQLPAYKPSPSPSFRWGRLTGAAFAYNIQSAYLETVHWRRNTFMVLLGKAGKQFIRELTVLFTAYANSSDPV